MIFIQHYNYLAICYTTLLSSQMRLNAPFALCYIMNQHEEQIVSHPESTKL
jgi:hypothetical protein